MGLGTLKIVGKTLKGSMDDAYKKFTQGGGSKNKKITIQKKDIDKKITKQEQVSKKAENLAKKQKKTKKVTPTDTPVKELASKAKQKRNIKSKVNKAEKVFSQKEYNKKLLDNLKKNQKNKISKNTTKNTNKQSTALTVTKQPSTKTGTNLVTIPKGTNIVKKKTTALTTIPKNVTTNAGKIAYLKKHFGKHWKKYAIGLGVITAGYLVPKDKNPSEGSISGGGNKDKKPLKKLKNIKVKTIKTKSLQQKKKELPKTKSNDYTGRFINKKGDVAYDSASDFFAHMFGTPKKRAMPKKTSRIIGTGDKLKRKDADKKGAGKGVKFKAFKSGTKDKTIGKPKSYKKALGDKYKDKSDIYGMIFTPTGQKSKRKRTMIEKIFGGGPNENYNRKINEAKKAGKKLAGYEMFKEHPELMKRAKKEMTVKKSAGKTVGLKPLPPKSQSPGIHKLPAKAKMNMGFKPMFGGGFISSLYDKPEKIEKYKGNTTSARQVKGYGKAKKKA